MGELSDPIAMIGYALKYCADNGQIVTEEEYTIWSNLVSSINEGYYYQDDRYLRINFGD